MKYDANGSGAAFIRCREEHFDAVTALYERSLDELEKTVNYPKWTKDHPGREYVAQAIGKGEQFACVADGEIVGAVVLSEDPEGAYELGNWSRELENGEYIVFHILAVEPECKHCGIGSFLVDNSVAFARRGGYKAVRLDIVPDNIPARRLYESKGFTSAGILDLRRDIPEIPLFEIFELNLV